MKNLFYLCVLLLLTLACGPNNPEEDQRFGTMVLSAEDTDSLYQHYLTQKPNDYPVNAILERGKLYPEDAAPLDTSFLIYRGRLLDAVNNKDLISLLGLMDGDIQCSFGGCQGKTDFAAEWELLSPEKMASSTLWKTLEGVLMGGGAFENEAFFSAPYYYARWPEDYDPFEYGLITGEMVRLRAKPQLGSDMVAYLTQDVVKVLDTNGPQETINGEAHPWIKIESLDGKTGYLWGKFFASSMDYRAGFERQNGDWKMVFFLAGD